ncbi:tagatose-6-phosphate kinase [Candidatus Enterococcus ferrettii]|uniref:Tagatose-6-phosphate kinase n=1 Tax=Candidatus Enterococcus ferrettii TaxID=2815324 RepID=A0ABV0EMQ7_9ENTE|nr:tagatose-6-phosphate kinase [Enterococcus sp. 665A]MBO1339642.1 tagatose-6-phosphate kinase [Enterococcus sp. 665A]
MIVTITMNPSIDISYPLESFQLNTVNRLSNTRKTAGGKGLNVTRVLKQLNHEVIASGLLGGYVGEGIKAELNAASISHQFAEISGNTRNCIAILHEGKQTEILESGPIIQAEEVQSFLTQLDDLIPTAEVLTISGSLPQGVPEDFYVEVIKRCNDFEKPVVLDCSGKALQQVLSSPYKPCLIKPNQEELSELLGISLEDPASIKNALMNDLFTGIQWVVISLGAQGAVAKHQDTFYRVTIPKIDVENPVGSGDATVAGFAAAIAEGKDAKALLKRGNVLGMLNAQEAVTGAVNLANYQQLFDQIEVTTF